MHIEVLPLSICRSCSGTGTDVMHAGDAAAEELISAGPGPDTAFYDLGLDPARLATETTIPPWSCAQSVG